MIIAVLLVGGLILLSLGAELLVKGSSGIALRAGIPSLVVGLTIVAFGTSAPELVVSIRAGLEGAGNIAVGNVVGSNIVNVAVILGISSLITPMKVNLRVLKFDVPVVIVVSFILLVFLIDRRVDRLEALILGVLFISYVLFTIVYGRREQAKFNGEDEMLVSEKKRSVFLDMIFITAGLAGLVFGARMFVNGATEMAINLGISDSVIGLTIVAGGTSLPELATSVIAALKREEDIAIGNIIGSNIFNILGIIGISGTITPLTSEQISYTDLFMMLGIALFLLPLMRTGYRIVRLEGALLLMIYIGYLWYLWP